MDLSIVEHLPIQAIIDDHITTPYGNIRFGARRIGIPDAIQPPEVIEPDELTYVEELLKAYADDMGSNELTLDILERFPKYNTNYTRQRKDYYSAETIRRLVRDVFTDSRQFHVLKEETYDGVIEVYEEHYSNGFERLNAVAKHASLVSVDKSLLCSKLHCVGNSEKKGVCHMLVNDRKLKWVKNND